MKFLPSDSVLKTKVNDFCDYLLKYTTKSVISNRLLKIRFLYINNPLISFRGTANTSGLVSLWGRSNSCIVSLIRSFFPLFDCGALVIIEDFES